ncbi:aminopeptidase [Ralstonia solanacearum]|uniref:aminopeptidase n=1 Tax=Ralstonia solanacearum TaxID=305 RepID=UPI0006DC708F|nr:aminopeptidase [Ralstonia solanacearum]
MRAFRAWVSALFLAGSALLAGCDTVGYYYQSVAGHLSLMAQRQSLDEAIDSARQAHDDKLARRLEDARAIRAYASRELDLPDNRSYRVYANIKRPFAVWNVFAAPELSVKLKEWCFLVVGCVTYRGYYDRAAAQAYADTLRAEGWDVDVAGIPAYSTLGYFDDPLLNTFVNLPEGELARLIFHELAHQVVYAKGDTAFNESFATAVETIGVERWLADVATPEIRSEYSTYDARRVQFRALLLDYRNRLEALYASAVSDAEKRAGKRALFDSLRADYAKLKAGWGGYAGYDRWFAQPLSNAHLGAVASYLQWVPAFTALYQRDGGDWARFYADVKAMAHAPQAERTAALTALAPPAAPGAQASRAASTATSDVSGRPRDSSKLLF